MKEVFNKLIDLFEKYPFVAYIISIFIMFFFGVMITDIISAYIG